ncbi:MAG: transcription antitermination factor NusB [Candidatus Peribacteraceae bacterium]
MARKRHLSRIAVMQVLFEHLSRGVNMQDSLQRNVRELGEADSAFAEVLLSGVLDHEEELQKAIVEHAPGWTLERMDPIARCVLFVGTFELLFANDAPPAVAMNEAIDIAKEYGTDESGKFVNGVLNAIAHDPAIAVNHVAK